MVKVQRCTAYFEIGYSLGFFLFDFHKKSFVTKQIVMLVKAQLGLDGRLGKTSFFRPTICQIKPDFVDRNGFLTCRELGRAR